MAELINLRLRRKQKQRVEKENDAAANRALFGETKEVRRKRKNEAELAGRRLDSHKMEEP